MKVMIVDDSRAMRTILSRMLRRAGATEILEAGDGKQAVELLSTSMDMPELAIVDWNMPVMNGLELVMELRQRAGWRGIAIVMCTTENEHSQVVRALAAGAHEYVIKPFDEPALLGKLAILGFGFPEALDGPQPATNPEGGTQS